jgi:purine-binding chemotaxis protein CheW
VRGRLVGLLVDAVAHVLKVPITLVSEPPEEVGAGASAHVVGVARLEDRLVILLDLDQTLLAGQTAAKGS